MLGSTKTSDTKKIGQRFPAILLRVFFLRITWPRRVLPAVCFLSGWMRDSLLFFSYTSSLGIFGTELLFSPLLLNGFSDYSERKGGGGNLAEVAGHLSRWVNLWLHGIILEFRILVPNLPRATHQPLGSYSALVH